MLALIPAALGGPLDLLARALVFVVFTAGALAALAVTLRRPSGPRAPATQIAYASFSGIVAALLAVGLGGPGALPWLVLACIAGAFIHQVESRQGGPNSGPGPGPEDRASETGPMGQVVRVGHALAVVLAALTAGALLLSQQASELLRASGGAAAPVLPWALGLGLAAATFTAIRRAGPHAGRSGDRWLAPLTLLALGVYTALIVSLLFNGPGLSAIASDIVRAAFDGQAALAGGLAAAAQGVLRASVAGGVGGVTAAQPNQRGAWGEPLVVAAVALLTGLAAHASKLSTPTPIVGRELHALEHHLRDGLTPSDYGQLIVLPRDSELQPGQRYQMVLRADPRGHRYGQAFREENVVAAPAWDFTRTVDTVILRDKDPERSKNAGFDLRIPVRRELVETRLGPFLRLHPIDPNLNFRQLMAARDLEGPFLNVADYSFEAGVVRSFHLGEGERSSLYAEPPPPDAPKNPALRDFITFNYTGPFAAGERPPLALTAPTSSGLTPGSIVHLRLDSPARGLELGFINRLGELEVPAWDFLAGSDTAVLRHKTNPELDRTIRVHSRLAFGRLRFTSPELELDKLAKLLPEYSGPYLLPSSYHFAAEVHHGARLRGDLAKTHLALIPVHPQTAPIGNPGLRTYNPHPGEVLLTGMQGPFPDREAVGTLVAALADRFGPVTATVAALALLVLALASLVRWYSVGLRSARSLFGKAPEFGFGLAFLVCVALAPAVGLPHLMRAVDAIAAIAVLLGLARLLARLPRSRPAA